MAEIGEGGGGEGRNFWKFFCGIVCAIEKLYLTLQPQKGRKSSEG